MIVTEFARGGDLSAKIHRHLSRREKIDEEVIWRYFIQLCRGLQSLHASNVIHRDIKSANIYLVDAKRVAIGDFGISKVLKCSTAMASTQIGTPYYMAPEIWTNQRYNEKCDVWALGVVLYELCALRHPFLGATERSLRDRVLKGQYDPLPSSYSPALRDVLRLLLAVDPRARPAVDQILAHPAVAARAAAADLDACGPVALLDTIRAPAMRRQQPRLPGPMYDAIRAAAPPPGPAGPASARLPLLLPSHPPQPSAPWHLPPGGLMTPASERLSEPGGPAGPRSRFSGCLPGPPAAANRHSLPDLKPPPPRASGGGGGMGGVLPAGMMLPEERRAANRPVPPWDRCGPSMLRGRRAVDSECGGSPLHRRVA
jgi:serine/threonine protein kinase